jgi:hypothetical protein
VPILAPFSSTAVRPTSSLKVLTRSAPGIGAPNASDCSLAHCRRAMLCHSPANMYSSSVVSDPNRLHRRRRAQRTAHRRIKPAWFSLDGLYRSSSIGRRLGDGTGNCQLLGAVHSHLVTLERDWRLAGSLVQIEQYRSRHVFLSVNSRRTSSLT